MFGLEPWHIIVVLVVAVLVFGGKRLPELGKGIGEGWRGFKEGLSGNNSTTPEKPGDTTHTVTPAAKDELKPPPAA